MKLLKKFFSFFTKETVLCVSVILALLSCLFVPPPRRVFFLYRLEHVSALV